MASYYLNMFIFVYVSGTGARFSPKKVLLCTKYTKTVFVVFAFFPFLYWAKTIRFLFYFYWKKISFELFHLFLVFIHCKWFSNVIGIDYFIFFFFYSFERSWDDRDGECAKLTQWKKTQTKPRKNANVNKCNYMCTSLNWWQICQMK